MSGFNMPPGVSPGDIPGNEAPSIQPDPPRAWVVVAPDGRRCVSQDPRHAAEWILRQVHDDRSA